jgi:peptidoglycan/LPS O-acetylase OafA/YrhL
MGALRPEPMGFRPELAEGQVSLRIGSSKIGIHLSIPRVHTVRHKALTPRHVGSMSESETPAAMNSQREIKSLTGIRGVAACFVVIYHYLALGSGSGLTGTVIKHGYLAVDLFFVLSGTVMALTYGQDFRERFKVGTFARFLTRRLARVYPLYLATSLACLILYYADREAQSVLPEPTWLAVGSNLLLVQAWGIGDSINGPGWSISTELFAYVLFPCLVSVLIFGPARIAAAVAALGGIGLCALAAVPDAAAQQTVRFGPLDLYMGQTVFPLMRCGIEFCLGLLAWRLMGVPQMRRLAGGRFVGDGLAAAILLLLAIRDSDVILVLLFVPLIMALAAGRGVAARLLGSPPLHALGVLSYSIYLVHRPVLDHLEPPVVRMIEAWQIPHPHLLAAVLLVPCTVLISVATFRLIEKPGRQLARGIGFRRDRAPASRSGPQGQGAQA